ncbi:hypothetical protein Rumeso_00708 [Rubellimicrobium mesophilum DSM 19309]|uniref:Uncharacterized protein n=1 Tax=Rubellimicrobium mesophilum DSM 19309 TaxID=442562 RepID=A0A017HSV8_9RHOB|nr:hypothetical protein [Rubellimicrobium mesophilum]EYD77542.1 hypothetical protein Rumeso_00708 [Rubellimicrobium mesophilum DSM 19309]
MPEQPNPPDRDDPVTERAVSMDTRPAEPDVGAGRAINAAFSRRRPEGMPRPQVETTGQQDLHIEGPGYPSEDMDDVDPEEDDAEDEEDDAEDEDDDGYRVKEEEQGLESGDGQLPDLMPERDRFDSGNGAAGAGRDGSAPGMETGDGQLEELLVPPGGDDLGGDRDSDPNLNGGHGISMMAPEEGPIPIEDEPTDTSIIGHGHEDKAAWNRDRVAHLQDIEDDEGDLRDATSEAMGLGGAVLGGELKGWEGGDASPTVDQGVDPRFDDELSETEEVLGDMQIEDAPDVLDDESIDDPNNMPFLPEHRDLPDDNVDLEERLIATDGEDVLSSGPELGVVEELEAEDLNETDNISQAFEDQREFMDDAMEGNERRGGVEDD